MLFACLRDPRVAALDIDSGEPKEGQQNDQDSNEPWFDTRAQEAASFYCSVFPNSTIRNTTYYPEVGQEIHGKPAGSILTVEFELDGQPFVALNGGPDFTFSEAVSLEIQCADQGEVDHYWENLTPGGDPAAQECGWLNDRFGLSWQVVPVALEEMLADPDKAKADRAFEAMLAMKKLDVAALREAFEGK